MYYYAMLNSMDVVTSVYALLSQIPESRYFVEISKAWYEDKRVIGMKYDRASHSFMFWACSTDNVQYLNTTQSLSDKLAEIDTELSAEGGNVASLVAEVADVKATAESIQNELADTNTDIKALKGDIANQIAENNRQNTELARIDTNVEAVIHAVNDHEARIIENREDIEEANKAVNDLDSRVSANAGDIAALIGSVNSAEKNITSLTSRTATVESAIKNLPNEYISKTLQATSNTGGMRYTYYVTSGINVLDEILTYPTGISTVYCQAGVAGIPKSETSWRMILHKTNSNIGWIVAFDYMGSVYSNYLDGTKGYRGWKELYNAKPTALWNGVAYPTASDSIVPSKKLSECHSGWVLMWSDYDANTETANNYDFHTSVIYKCKPDGSNWNGESFNFNFANFVPADESAEKRATKKLKIYDDRIVGYEENSTGNRIDVVLRAVVEF